VGDAHPRVRGAVIEWSRGDGLSQETEPINPRVDTDEWRVPFLDFDGVGSGDGRPR
jgi:hypothetical protein